MVDTKPASVAVQNWKDSIGSVPAKYKRGVEAAQNVMEKSRAAEPLWQQAVQEAAARQARLQGLQRVSDADWKKAASEKGAARIGQGMAAAEGKFANRIPEVLSALSGITLGPRTTDPAANVDNRVKPIAVGLHQAFKK